MEIFGENIFGKIVEEFTECFADTNIGKMLENPFDFPFEC
jgi:hypothetical protein